MHVTLDEFLILRASILPVRWWELRRRFRLHRRYFYKKKHLSPGFAGSLDGVDLYIIEA